jgi:predicted TIM-barrel fold metal-dependent hydrolase
VLSRRRLIGGTLAAGALLSQRIALAGASNAAATVNFAVPPGACDCHVHIIGDPAVYPLSPARGYTPPMALPSELARLHRTLGIGRVIIVTPSIYGTDNAVTLWALGTRPDTARGVAVIDDKTPEHALDAMHRAGVRGARLNLQATGADAVEARHRFTTLAKRLAPRPWHIQIYTTPDVVAGLKDTVLASHVPVVFDHFGGAQGELGAQQTGFVELVQMVASGKAYVKISGAYRFSKQPPDLGDMGALARVLVQTRAERVLWGTDWPHTNSSLPGQDPMTLVPPIPVDDVHMLNLLAVWVPDPKLRAQILVDNPQRLYDF